MGIAHADEIREDSDYGTQGRRRPMKIHTDKLTREDLYAHLPVGVGLDLVPVGSRKRGQGFVVSLSYLGQGGRGSGRRPKNSGCAGSPRTFAASWDEWGIWMAALYEIDPDAIIGTYKDRGDFYGTTAKWRPRGMEAPWLEALPQDFATAP